MQKKFFILVFMSVALLVGCAAPASPTQFPAESPTVALSTLTPTLPPPLPATETPAIPTLTPEPVLRTTGPYFAYFQQSNLVLHLIFMDADGRGRKVIELPQAISDAFAYGTLPAPDMRSVSPDGGWLAFYTGTAGSYGEMPAPGSADLTLNLMDLNTGDTKVVTPLLSADYPNDFSEAAQQLNDPSITADSLFEAFMSGITQSLAWSPDGRYLAFAGQMDGWSSDLYVYDTTEQNILRLTSGDQQLQWINWSPDGKWIVHGSVYAVGAGMTFDVYAATLGGSSAPYLSTNILYNGIEHWLNDHQYFENDGENGPGDYGLRLVDINTGGITRIWDGAFHTYGVDKSGRWVAVFAWSQDSPKEFSDPNYVPDFDFVPALYLIDLMTLDKLQVEFPNPALIQPFGVGDQAFVIMAQFPIFLSEDGSLTETELGDVNISVAPNAEYWLAAGEEVKIFGADNSLIKTSPSPLPGNYLNFSWSPDSTSVFLVAETEIYVLNILDGTIELIETNLMDGQGLYYQWIGGQ